MINDIIDSDVGPHQQTPCRTPKNIHMDPMTHGPCPIEVSDIVVKWHWYVGVVFLVLGGKGNG